MKKAFLVLLLTWGTAIAQSYPAKPVKLIVSYPPGGSSDLMARVFGAKLTELWGQQVIVESKPGAAGAIGTEYARTPAGRRLHLHDRQQRPVAINPLLSPVPYNVEKDFIPVSQISAGPNVLVVRADAPFKSLSDIVEYGKQNPGKLNYGTSGPGSISHLSSEMLKNLTKVNAVEVPYKGGGLAVTDLLGGQINFIFSDTLPAMAHVRGGKLRALCLTGAEPFSLLPELKMCESDVPGLVALKLVGRSRPRRRAAADRCQAARRHRQGARRSGGEEEICRPRRDRGVEHAGRVQPLHQGGGGQVRQADQGSEHQGEPVTPIGVAVIGTGWCGGIRAETLAAHALVSSLHIADVNKDRLAS